MSATEDSVKSVISGLVGAFEKDNQESYQSVSQHQEVVNAVAAAKEGEAGDFFMCLLYPFSGFIDGLLSEVTNSHKAQFFLKHGEFVERHFNELINKYEGMPCCSDKSRVIMRALIAFHMNGKKIAFNYEQEYTYHLPKIIFKDHNQIVDFADALHSLYYGHSELYIKSLAEIMSSVKDTNV
ncbi:MAG: hypothetical protein QM500_12310 [Methylococcales bacterium]